MQKVVVSKVSLPIGEKKPTILTMEDGAVMSGFDPELKKVKVGSELNVEIEVQKGKYINITKFEVLSEGSGSHPGPALDREAYKADPDKLASEETRSAVHNILSLFGQIETARIAAGIESKDHPIPTELANIIDKAITWCGVHIPDVKAAPKPAPISAPKEAASLAAPGAPQDLTQLVVKTKGDLFSACLKHYDMNQSDVLKELGGIILSQITNPQESWLTIVFNHLNPAEPEGGKQ